MICFNGSDLISLKANNGLIQPRLQDDDDDDDDVIYTSLKSAFNGLATIPLLTL